MNSVLNNLSDNVSKCLANLTELYDYAETMKTAINSSDRDESSKACDETNGILNKVGDLELSIKRIAPLLTDIKANYDNVADVYRKNLLNELEKFSTRSSGGDAAATPRPTAKWSSLFTDEELDVKNWGDLPPPEPIEDEEWNVVTSKATKKKMHNFSVKIARVKIHPDGMTVELPTVSNDAELKKLPVGMMVYHTGKEVPKIVMTTGKNKYVSVPLGCRIWDPNSDDNIYDKYSTWNTKLPNIDSRMKSFYINEEVAKKYHCSEDKTRNFRPPMRSYNDEYKQWLGYYVWNNPQFGDSKYLANQIPTVGFEDTSDLYQSSLWWMLVSILHYQNRTV